MTIAFVLGNGVSRVAVDLDTLARCGPVYGCNALYREFTPHCLVATDRPIATEIQETGYSGRARFHTRRPMPGLGARPVPKAYYGNSSGPIATSLAALDGHNRIYLLGFDLGPSSSGKFNNVYANTQHYKKSSDHPTFTGNWTRQLATIARDFAQVEFVRVHGETTADILDFATVPNMKKLAMEHFLERINTSKDL
jgi:hypothetical protein